MVNTTARMELERAYEVLVECQDVDINSDVEDRRLEAAMGVITAWEAVSDQVMEICQESLARKALTAQT